jgi:hypothetical protein
VYHPENRGALEGTDFSVLYHKSLRELVPLEGPAGQGDKWVYGEAGLGHLVVWDYDASYYSYLF